MAVGLDVGVGVAVGGVGGVGVAVGGVVVVAVGGAAPAGALPSVSAACLQATSVTSRISPRARTGESSVV